MRAVFIYVERVGTMRQEPLVVCAYGWGKEFRLYPDCLEVNGLLYALADLEHVRPIYHRVLGIGSARLELRFGQHEVLLPGISAVEVVQKVVAYLSCFCPQKGIPELRPGANWCISDLQRQVSTSIPAHEKKIVEGDRRTSGQLSIAGKSLKQGKQAVTPSMAIPGLNKLHPVTDYDISMKAYAQALTAPLPAPHWDRLRQEQRARRQRRLQAERSIREHGFDIERLAQRLQEADLPRVPLSVHLAPGEFAHYKAEATLREGPYLTESFGVFPAKDQGTIILTNKRFIYIGRTCQMVLDYARLAEHMRLRGAIVLKASHWSRQEVFEIQRPLECAMYLECLLKRFRQQQIYDEAMYVRKIAQHQARRAQRRQLQTPSIMDLDTIPLAVTPSSLSATLSQPR